MKATGLGLNRNENAELNQVYNSCLVARTARQTVRIHHIITPFMVAKVCHGVSEGSRLVLKPVNQIAVSPHLYSADRGEQHSPKIECRALSAIEWSGILLQPKGAAISQHRMKQYLTIRGRSTVLRRMEQHPSTTQGSSLRFDF